MASSFVAERRGGVRSWPGAGRRGASVSPPDPSGTDRRLPRASRLTARRQFSETYARGRRVPSACFTLFALPNTCGHCRLGITVTRRVGCAVVRNRLKRVVRDIFRRHRTGLAPALDVVVNVRSSMIGRSTREIEREFLAGFARAGRSARR